MQRLPTAYELRYRRSVRSQVAELRPLSIYKRYARRLARARADLAEGAWEVVAVLLVLYDAIWTPYLAFMGVREDALLALSLGVDGFFLVDLLVHARLRHARGQPQSVAGLLPWVLCCAPVELAHVAEWPWLRLYKMARIHRLVQHWTRSNNDIRVDWNLVNIVATFVVILMTGHWAALAWRALSQGGVQPRALADATPLYLRDLYFTVLTMTSVGYGDITPAADSAPQQFFAWGVMFVGTAMYAILFAVMTTYISNLDAMGDHFRTDVQQTIAWANYRELPDELRSRILRYFSYKWRKCRGLNEVDVIEELPRSIAQDVNLEIYRSLIQKVPLFKGVEISFIRAIVKFTCAPLTLTLTHAPCYTPPPSPREAAPERPPRAACRPRVFHGGRAHRAEGRRGQGDVLCASRPLPHPRR